MPACPKPRKRHRIKPGKKMQQLYDKVYERDNHKCIACGEYVEHGAPAHHVKRGKDKEDRMEFMVTACPPGTPNNCHDKTDSAEHRERLENKFNNYLRSKHPEFYNKFDKIGKCPNIFTHHCDKCDNELCPVIRS